MQRFPSQIISPGKLAQLQLVNGKNANKASHLSPSAPRPWTANAIPSFWEFLFPLKPILRGMGGFSQVPSKGRVLKGREQLREKFEEITVLRGLRLSEPHFPHLRSQLVLPWAAVRLNRGKGTGPAQSRCTFPV